MRSKNKAERRPEVDLTRVGDLQGQDNERKIGKYGSSLGTANVSA